MVRVIKTEIAPGLSQLFGGKALEGSLGCNRHKHGELYGAMGERQD